MIKLPVSIQSEYTLCWSLDPALQLPADPAERERALDRARLTGQWPTVDGQEPTRFRLRNLSHSDLSWILGESRSSTEHGRALSPNEIDNLTVRLALEGIDGFGSHKVEHHRIGSQRRVAKSETIDALAAAVGEHATALLSEFSRHIVERAQGGLDPL